MATKIQIYDVLVPKLQRITEQYPGQAPNLTAATNAIIELYADRYYDLLKDRTETECSPTKDHTESSSIN